MYLFCQNNQNTKTFLQIKQHFGVNCIKQNEIPPHNRNMTKPWSHLLSLINVKVTYLILTVI